MKKILIVIIAVIAVSFSSQAFDKYSIDRSDLPEAAQ